MKAALKCFKTLQCLLLLPRTTSDIVKLQKHDQDVLEAYAMINDVIVCLASTRHQSTLFMNEDILKLANKEGATVPVK